MSAFDELYQEVLLEHSNNPKNSGLLPNANCRAEGNNPLCGDHLELTLVVKDGVIEDVGFDANGCAISRASASMMSDLIKGKRIDEASAIFEKFHAMVTADGDSESLHEDLAELAAFSGVRAYPMRVKCATLAWHAMQAAVEDEKVVVSTE